MMTTAPEPRRWYSLHLTTWIVVALYLGYVVAMNLVGRYEHRLITITLDKRTEPEAHGYP